MNKYVNKLKYRTNSGIEFAQSLARRSHLLFLRQVRIRLKFISNNIVKPLKYLFVQYFLRCIVKKT